MVLSPAALLLALLGGESGMGITPYLLGYALFLERGPSLGRRLATIVPRASVGAALLAYHTLAGYGTWGIGFYLDPIGQPAAWLTQRAARHERASRAGSRRSRSPLHQGWTPCSRPGFAIGTSLNSLAGRMSAASGPPACSNRQTCSHPGGGEPSCSAVA